MIRITWLCRCFIVAMDRCGSSNSIPVRGGRCPRRSFSENFPAHHHQPLMTTCLRHCLRRPLPTSSKPSINHRRPFSSPPLPSTFYVQRFHRSSEQYILLLSKPSLPMGRITLSTLPPSAASHTPGPIIAFVDPLPPELITQNWLSFVENAGFREVLQAVVRENIAGEEMLVNEARGLPGGDGWVHLCDERALPAYPSPLSPVSAFFTVSFLEGVCLGRGLTVDLDGFRNRRILLGRCW